MIVIVDLEMGNVGSVRNMVKRIGAEARISSDVAEIEAADRLILPGVGAFDHGMRSLRRLGLLEALNHRVLDQETPVLGICLGMQLLTRGSEEGDEPGLGWIAGDTIRFGFDPRQAGLKIPQMGWNTVVVQRRDSLFRGFDDEPRFYFVHSYHVVCDRPEDVLATTWHGYDFAAAVHRANVWGTQFHPEKSHKFGIRLLTNFLAAG